jgi:hypothetical protein
VDAAVLPAIPLVELGEDWPVDSLARDLPRAHALLDGAQGRVPDGAVRLADRVSRRWLLRADPERAAEVDRIAALIGRPGAHFLNVSYEWGCSTVAADGPEGAPRLARVLDWPTPGLGRHAVAYRVNGPAGRFVSVAWPGYTGVLQGVAPGRFAAALNQAPMAKPLGLKPLDWAVNAARVWRRPRMTPAHLLRAAFETARGFAEACALIRATPLSSGALFVLAGVRPGETALIERGPDDCAEPAGPAAVANAWVTPGRPGRPRGDDNPGRRARIAALAPDFGDPAAWVVPPVLNDDTRLSFVAEAATGAFLAQGWEGRGPATAALRAVA